MKKIILSFLLVLFFAAKAVCAPIEINFEDNIYHIILSGERIKKRISFVASEKLITNKEAHNLSNSVLTINTGFFDPKNQKTISYIITDGNVVVDPLTNENLLSNPLLRQNMDKILNRSEFRVVECDNKYHYEIVPHKTPVEFGCRIVTAAQGGPQILPEMRLEEEFFTLTRNGKIVRQSASVLNKTARTIIGIKDGNAHILIITDKNPMTIFEVQDLCKKLGFESAMGFDGGGSTSFNYKKEIHVVSRGTFDDDTGRALKSFMIIKK